MISIRKPKDKSFGLDMAPMINVVFLLLIFFMLTSSAMQAGNEVELPESQSARKIEKDTLPLKVYPDGALTFNGRNMEMGELAAELAKVIGNKEDTVLEIQADKQVPFKICGEVIRLANGVGIREFVFATDLPGN
ncbi:ExbD/TolR family protein [Nitrospina watsonii]|uniref:Biopolymer transport protein ExbD/TolR n=1 Tax=Nitrospina watsonii TaxID=1323948 RepID=A0ABM9HC63_9BACT|nr:biopolymer transporter ExbD [Nitrospina watsonii]CAI2717676.1 Biopolymer transport protein ExbD/TolR [Nitrospina watsonii]